MLFVGLDREVVSFSADMGNSKVEEACWGTVGVLVVHLEHLDSHMGVIIEGEYFSFI